MKTINITIVCFLLLTTSVFLTACGSKSSSSNATPVASLAMKGISGNNVNMNGTWKSCMHGDRDHNDEIDTFTFSGDSMSINTSLWSASTTSNCEQTTNPDVLIVGTVTATLGAEAPAIWTDGNSSTLPPTEIAANAKATKVTYVNNSLSLTLGSAAIVNYYNNKAFCGKTNWAIGVATDILNCLDITLNTTDYWVVDDSATVLKLYSQITGTAPYQVDSINPWLK